MPSPPRTFPDGEHHGRNHERNRFVAPTVIYAAPPPVMYYGAPPYDSSDEAAAPAYAPAPAYDSPVMYEPPPRPTVEPVPSVIEYPTGRYVLRGDGISMPHTWVWIPNPPAGPPVLPPAAPVLSPPPAPSVSAPSPRATIYRWTDEQGVVHFTDSSEAVPLEYRAQAKQPPS